MIKNVIGGPATGGNFFDRVDTTRRLWSRLDTDNVLLLAPRRVGKTSLLRKMQADAELHGFDACYLSVSDLSAEKEFVEALLAAVLEHPNGAKAVTALVDGPLKGVLRRVKKVSAAGFSLEIDPAGAASWRHVGESLARTMAGLNGRWLMMVDELPLFVLSLLEGTDGKTRARTFLNWFRELRLDARLECTIRWVLCGSIGLDTVARREGMGDTINDLALAQLGAFSDETADEFLVELGRSYNILLNKEVRARMTERIGWLIPHHLQLLFGELRERHEGTEEPPTPETVDAVYATLLVTTNRSYFDWWAQRLGAELDQSGARAALLLLNAVAPTDRGLARDDLQVVLDGAAASGALTPGTSRLGYLLDVLVSDGYLVDDDGRFRFRSPIIRDYWRKRVLP